MLLHQFILLVAAWARRFDALLLNAFTVARRVVSRAIGGSDLQQT